MANTADTPDTTPGLLNPAAAYAGMGDNAGSHASNSHSFSHDLLVSLLRLRDGDFDVRLASDFTGIEGKIADVFNEILAVSARRADEIARVCRVVGKEGKLKQRMQRAGRRRRLGRRGRVAQHAHRRPGLADHGGHARHRRRRQGRPHAGDGARGRRTRARGRVSPVGAARQQDDRPAVGLHVGGDARRARGRHRRQARRPGAGEGRLGRVEGPHRVGQPDGRQPDGAGAQHRRGDHRRRQRRPLEEDHRRRSRRDPAAEGSHQHDGRAAPLVRLGGDARRARGRHRRKARRAGGRARASPARGRT